VAWIVMREDRLVALPPFGAGRALDRDHDVHKYVVERLCFDGDV